MFNFFNLKPDSFGLAISDSFIKIAKLKKRGNFFKLASFGKSQISPGIIEDSQIKNEEGFINSVREAIKKVRGDKIKTKNVVFSLPENKAFFTIIQMPKMTEEELELAVPFEAENYIPIQAEEFYCDFEVIKPLKNNLDHLDILVAALPRKIVDPYIYCLKKAGLAPLALEIESCSISRAVIKNEVSPFPLLILNFEERYTNLTIFSGCSLHFTTSLPISSEQLTNSIAKSLNIDFKEAERIKFKYGIQLTSSKKRKLRVRKEEKLIKSISEALIPILSDLQEQIKKHINYYQTHFDHQHLLKQNLVIEKIIISGKEANLKGFPSFLSFSLNIPLEIANPWINILPEPLKEVPELSFEESLEYTAALGLALRGMKEKII
jgi:type IV pilus assembly protein PilM